VQIAGYRRDDVEVDPPYLHPDYVATRTRAPKRPLLLLPHTLSEVTGPVYGHERIGELDHDLTRQHDGEPIGERIILHGRVLDGDGRPVRGTLVEIWQANSAGRYAHQREQHDAPLDPNFTGTGRTLTDDEGCYRFTTVQPGPYPWRNHVGAWRPAHIHFSLFGSAFTQRLVTQMYFPNDPLFPYDPILQSVTDEAARQRLIATYDHSLSVPEFSLGYHWDIVLDGPHATWIEEGR
jgi:protocatechuate 3,4-dioxygenase beta subunit